MLRSLLELYEEEGRATIITKLCTDHIETSVAALKYRALDL